jgi:PKD repeat protein
MITALSPTPRRGAPLVVSVLVFLAACGGDGILAPHATSTPTATAAHASVVVTSNYSAFDTRTDFNAQGLIDHLDGFEEFTGQFSYKQDAPWPRSGVTYTSAPVFVLNAFPDLGIQSNSVAAELGFPLTGTFAADDAVTLFGADLTLYGAKVPVGLVLSTNLGSYSFDNLDVPITTSGRRFFGIALANAGEHLTAFRFTVGGSGSALLLDNVAVGHVAAHNADPVASTGGPYTGVEGSAVTFAMSATDADNDPVSYSWDLGDGTKDSGDTPPSSHVYADNGSYDIMLAVSDGRGGVDTVRTTATIANVAPAVAPFSVPTAPIALTAGGVSVPVSTTFADPGTLDTYTATLDCGTGVSAQSDAPNGSADGLCTFTSAGIYGVQITVRDDDGGTNTAAATGQIVIYDASAGWVTGGGWIESPAGAYAAAPSLAGKLTFNLAARYQPGSGVPAATADFKLNIGKLNFRSTSLDWLIVNGPTARLQGNGTLNGEAGYAFTIVTTDDAPVDAIRIRVWFVATGAVVYDSRPGDPVTSSAVSPLAGGVLQIH